MASYLWRKYANHLYYKWEKTILWDMVEPYMLPKSCTPLVTIYIGAFYTGVIGAAITEQLYKRIDFLAVAGRCGVTVKATVYRQRAPTYSEKYWEKLPGETVPLMKPKFYGGPWKVMKGEVPPFIKQE